MELSNLSKIINNKKKISQFHNVFEENAQLIFSFLEEKDIKNVKQSKFKYFHIIFYLLLANRLLYYFTISFNIYKSNFQISKNINIKNKIEVEIPKNSLGNLKSLKNLKYIIRIIVDCEKQFFPIPKKFIIDLNNKKLNQTTIENILNNWILNIEKIEKSLKTQMIITDVKYKKYLLI